MTPWSKQCCGCKWHHLLSLGVEEGPHNNDDDEHRPNHRPCGDSTAVNGATTGATAGLSPTHSRRSCKDRTNIRIYASNVTYYP